MSYPKPKGKRRIMRSFKMSEISAVDVPAQEGALAAVIKSGKPIKSLVIAKCGMDHDDGPALMTSAVDGHAHLVHHSDAMSGETSYGGGSGEEYGHAHPWIRDAMTGAITIGEQHSHTHSIEGAENKRAPVPAPATIVKESVMDPKDQEISKLKLETARLTEELAKALKLGELTDVEKQHANTLQGAQRELFIAKTQAEREVVVKAYTEVVYEDCDGNKYTKADDKRLVDAAKRSDAALKRAADAEERERATAMAKRAEDELAHWPGTAEDKTWLLGTLDKAATAEAGKDGASDVAKGRAKRIGEMLKGADNALSGVFEAAPQITEVTTEGEDGEVVKNAIPPTPKGDAAIGINKNADAQAFDRLVREEMVKSKTSEAKATVAVMNTARGSALYKSGYDVEHGAS